ncbi:MAG TPA: hypothetical protein DHV62_07130, partial [Elusimicrobia bacterium]|nr:hypothetical protein [Elusimicrobiota bacterium]
DTKDYVPKSLGTMVRAIAESPPLESLSMTEQCIGHLSRHHPEVQKQVRLTGDIVERSKHSLPLKFNEVISIS